MIVSFPLAKVHITKVTSSPKCMAKFFQLEWKDLSQTKDATKPSYLFSPAEKNNNQGTHRKHGKVFCTVIMLSHQMGAKNFVLGTDYEMLI